MQIHTLKQTNKNKLSSFKSSDDIKEKEKCVISRFLDIRVLISDTTAWRKEPEENTVILLVLTEQSKQIHCQLICISPKLYSIYISFGVLYEKTRMEVDFSSLKSPYLVII